jgi:tetratricopeptide (TPR) repeat protein
VIKYKIIEKITKLQQFKQRLLVSKRRNNFFDTIIMSRCARTGCLLTGTKSCSICLREFYCSSDCQKTDWKSHKLICQSLKMLPHQLQPYFEVVRVVKETPIETPEKKKLYIRFVKHLISYAENQFGDRVPGKAYREREDGECINNWTVEIEVLIPIYSELTIVYWDDISLGEVVRANLIIPYYKKMLDLLRPWSANCLNLNSIGPWSEYLDKDKINQILVLLSETERRIASMQGRINHFDLAEIHCQRAVTFAKLYDGTEKNTVLLPEALKRFCDIRISQGNYADAVSFAEEAYDYVAVAYNPVHPEVQRAAGTLIECLIQKGDLYDAERFSEMMLNSLKDPMNALDQESEAVAKGYYHLAQVIDKQIMNEQQGDSVKAEMLARESLRIRTQLNGNDHPSVGTSSALLANILKRQSNLGNETKELFERSLAINMKHCGPDGLNTANSFINIGKLYYLSATLPKFRRNVETRKEHLRLSIFSYKEAVRIRTKALGPDNPKTLEAECSLRIVSRG